MIALILVLLLAVAGVPGAESVPGPVAAGPPLRLLARPPAGDLRFDGPAAEAEAGDPGPIPLRLLPRYQGEASPGGIVRIETPSAAGAVLARIVDGRHRVVARGASFRLADRWVTLVGVPSTVAPGTSTLAIGVADGDVLRWGSATLWLVPRTFASETIPLNSGLTALRTVPDPRKDREAIEMARILAAVDPAEIWDSGPFAIPTNALRRSAGYGDRRVYRYDDGSTAQSVHEGADLAAAEGTPVTACGRGRVVFAGPRIVTGGTVVVEHLPGVFSLYYHMSIVLVSVGEVLEKGRPIGAVGMTGLATGPHLHWEIQVRGVAVDPDLLTGRALLP